MVFEFGKRILKKIFPSFFMTEDEIAATFVELLNTGLRKDTLDKQRNLEWGVDYYKRIDRNVNMIKARRPIHEKAKVILKEQQDTFLKIHELFGAGSLLFRIKEPKMLYFEKYSRTEDIIKKDRQDRLGGSKRDHKHLFLYTLQGTKTKEEARERLFGDEPILSNSPFYSSRFYKSKLFSWATDPKTVLERTILMLGVSINRDNEAGLDSKVKAQIKTFDDESHWREPYFYVNEKYSSHDTIYDGYNGYDDQSTPFSVASENSNYSQCMYSYAPGVMWLTGGGMMFESVSISPEDLTVFGCPWLSFKDLPFLDSPEFISYMENDKEFRLMAENYRKNNCPLLMTKRFYHKLTRTRAKAVSKELLEFKKLVETYNSAFHQAAADYSEYFF